eukprot:GHRQ01016779.1.p2 GENE.GHRQ01016779.1~~GHRQ01016779.1.p2  ORF type:complete len:130 (-),score=29.77 GHRQ01016779.1:118-507(-)
MHLLMSLLVIHVTRFIVLPAARHQHVDSSQLTACPAAAAADFKYAQKVSRYAMVANVPRSRHKQPHLMACSVRPSWYSANVWLAAAKLKDGASAAALPKQRSASAQSCRPAAAQAATATPGQPVLPSPL